MSQNQSITLYSQKDGADKQYKIDLTAVDHGYTVTGWNGRRLGPLKAQPKTPTPLPYAEAKAVFDALLKSKLKGGYQPGENGSEYVAVTDVGARSGIELHLLSPKPEADIERYLTDDSFIAQPKHDGERRPVARRETVIGGNRSGLQVPMPKTLIDVLAQLPTDTEIDSEQIGDRLYVFDAMKIDGKCLRHVGCLDRMRKAEALIDRLGNPDNVVAVETAIGTEAKRALYARLRTGRQEGIVFKKISSDYGHGKNDDQIKIKFCERATLEVSSVHPTKRSISVQGFAPDGTAVPLGNVTIPANFSIPACQELVEIEYLYVVSSLVQPVYKGVRTDLPRSACTTSQLKYRADLGDDDATNDQFAELAA